MAKPLDFLIIGAQKSGTTSLFQYLSGHPQLALPLGKEAPFFTSPERLARGWDAFAERHFRGAAQDRLWGKATPHYMTDAAVPQRLADEIPDVRLIAILRDPLDRAVSHYKMTQRRGHEPRSLATALAECAAELRAHGADFSGATAEDESRHYLSWSCYGAILARYREHFPREQLLLLFLSELEAEPANILRRVLQFLGVDPDYQPRNLGKRYLDSSRGGWYRTVRMLRRVLPRRYYTALTYRLNAQAPPGAASPGALEAGQRAELVQLLQSDVDLLERTFDLTVPWPEFHAPTNASARAMPAD